MDIKKRVTKVYPYCGTEITSTIAQAKQTAAMWSSDYVEFEFNDVTVRVVRGSDEALIYRDWERSLKRDEPFIVGPYPDPELSADELAEDARVEAANEERRAASAKAYAEREARETAELQALLKDAPHMEFNDGGLEKWAEFKRNNQDGYGKAVVDFARDWARLIEDRVAQGETIAECARECERLPASVYGLTGFQYGCAVSVLAQTWVHGEELRRYHNGVTQLGTEGDEANEKGGVLNPALLSIG